MPFNYHGLLYDQYELMREREREMGNVRPRG